jgi:hypothetical protein
MRGQKRGGGGGPHARHDVVGAVDDLGQGERADTHEGDDGVENEHRPPHVAQRLDVHAFALFFDVVRGGFKTGNS